MDGCQLSPRHNRRHSSSAVLQNSFAVIARPQPHIQASMDTIGYAALATEKAVRHT